MTIRILSWDVGIKNLAGCLLSHNSSSSSSNSSNQQNPFNIEWWDIINLSMFTPPICSNKYKNGTNCTCNALYSSTILDKTHYYCGHHKKIYDNFQQQCVFINIKPVDKNIKCVECYDIAKFYNIIDNQRFNYCTTHKNKFIKGIKLNTIKKQTLKDIDINTLKYNLWILLDKKPELLLVDEVIIENQPALKNPKMKSIAETLYNYFLCRGIIDKQVTDSTINLVKYICPSNKLKLNQDNTISILSKSKNASETYKLTKELSIQYCYQFIDNNQKLKDHLDKFKKKDDLCDALLQGLYYILVKKKPIK